MTQQSTQFIGSIPALYDVRLGPHLFTDYGADLARRTTADTPARVLEIAAGTGIVTRSLRDCLPSATHLVASDLNLPMLEIARSKFSSEEQIEFKTADAATLPFVDCAFEAVVCQFGVMFFPDKDKAYREAYRVLTPGGRYHFNVWDSFEFNPFARIVHETVAGFFTPHTPAFYTVPFGYHRIDEIKASLMLAGFDDISAHVLRVSKLIPNARAFAEGLILGNPIIEQINERGTIDPETIIASVTAALQRAFGEDPGRMPLQAIIFGARRP